MNIILENIEPELIKKLEQRAKNKGLTVTEEIKHILLKEANQEIIKTPENLGWSDDFFDKTAGSCADDPIIIV